MNIILSHGPKYRKEVSTKLTFLSQSTLFLFYLAFYAIFQSKTANAAAGESTRSASMQTRTIREEVSRKTKRFVQKLDLISKLPSSFDYIGDILSPSIIEFPDFRFPNLIYKFGFDSEAFLMIYGRTNGLRRFFH